MKKVVVQACEVAPSEVVKSHGIQEEERALLKKIQNENKRLCEAILKSKKQCEDIGDDKE